MTSLKDKTVLIIGRGSGIARAISVAVSDNGGRVIAAGRHPDDLAGAYRGMDIGIERADVTDESSVAALAARIATVDHVVSTASARARGGFAELTASLVNASFATKVTGPLLLAKHFAAKLQAGGAVLAGMWAHEALRIAARRPRAGLDTDHNSIPHEMGWIETAVHLSKGCYRGQETVARVHNLGHPPRRLVFLHLDGSTDELPGHGEPVQAGGTTVGFVGSSARHHELGPIALGLIKRTVPVDAPLTAAGVAAAQEVIVPPDAGANVQITLRRPRGDLRRSRP